MFTLFSVAESPIALDFSLDPAVLAEVSGTPRLGSLLSSHVLEVESLSHLDVNAHSPSVEGLMLALRESLERRICLWLGVVDASKLHQVQAMLGDACQIAGARREPHKDWALRLPGATSLVPLAVSPQRLLRNMLAPSSPFRAIALQHLEGLDPKRVANADLLELRRNGVSMVPRSLIFRLAHSPVMWAYAIVMLYSICRAIPVAYLPGFHGNIWVLWGLDVAGAFPYAWGVIAMFTASRLLVRLLALLVAVITFVAPYAYFWTHGHHYPFYVDVIVGCFIASALGFEMFRYVREKRVRTRLARAGAPASRQ